MTVSNATASTRLIAFVGSYGAAPGSPGGGVYVLDVAPDGGKLTQISHAQDPKDAGYLVFSKALSTLFVVDERKTDGRGPVDPPAAVHALRVNPDGSLRWLNYQPAPGPRPTFLDFDATTRSLVTANHGDFAHVERVEKLPNGAWRSVYVYDDSTVILFDVLADGSIGEIRDLQVLTGHGPDPNTSPQNGGHAQASPHAHCAVIDPSRRFVLVGDKGCDRILIYRLGATLELASTLAFPEQTGPRHIAFDAASGRAFATLEFSSEIVSMDFDAETGTLRIVDTLSTLPDGYSGRNNEPAEIRVHPNGRFAYVNNRGEDAAVWFAIAADGTLERRGAVSLAPSIHPGLAARSFAFSPSGDFMLLADRPAHLVRSYAVDGISGALVETATAEVPDPAFIAFAELPFQA